MNYPFWEVAISYGWLMASISVLHVFISHFAIGGGLYLVVVEQRARKSGDAIRLAFLEKVSKFFVLVTLVTGALTGVGIWFIIGLLNPAATEVLIHHFVWGWATEWTFFAVEIAAALVYYYGWRTMSARNHLIVGWIYFGAAWASLFVINGIIAFMLTPGEWLATGSFWDGFFNPTFWPSLVFRTGVCIMLAGVLTMLVASRQDRDNGKVSLVRLNAIWGLVGLIIMAPSMYWYWRAIPADITARALAAMPTPITALHYSFWWAGGVAALLILFGFLLPKRLNLPVSIVLVVAGLIWFGEFEWFRESVRKPYVITGYMYGNGLEVARSDQYREAGLTKFIAYRSDCNNRDLFRRSCRSCHTVNGYKPIRPALDGTDTAFIAALIMGSHTIKGNMPPFLGTEREAGLIAPHILRRLDQRHISEIYGLEGVELGRKVYDIRCGICHEIGGFNDKSESLLGLAEEDYYDILEIAGELGEEMPDFTGDDLEREALVQYLLSLGQTEGGQ